MLAQTFTFDLAIVLGVGALTSTIARALRQPSVLGYLFAGLVVGPYIPIPIFADSHRVETMAEFGVVLVMFAVGLEFRLRKLREVLPTSGLSALVQVGFLLWAGVALGQLLGWGTVESVFLGASLCISSTMLVSQVFSERPVDSDVRANVLGILVIQDIAAIVLIAAMTALAAGGGLGPQELGKMLLELLAVLVGIIGVGIFVVPRAIRAVARSESNELLIVVSIALCFGVAELAAVLGYSVALGAFVAGILVAESGKSHEVEELVAPLRDVFAAIFFVSIGMTVDPRLAWEHLPVSLLVFLLVIGGQFGSIATAGVLSGKGLRRSLMAGLALGQIGEFSFILAGVGIAAGVVRPELRPILVTVAILTAFTTPLMLRLGPKIVGMADRNLPTRLRRLIHLHEDWVTRLTAQPRPQAVESRRLRHALRTLTVDSVVAIGLVALMARCSGLAATFLSTRTFLSFETARYLLLGLTLALLIPLTVGAVRSALWASRTMVDRVLPPEEAAYLGIRVSRNSMRAMLTLAATLGVGVPMVAVLHLVGASTFGAGLLTAVVGGIAVHLWRGTRALDDEFRSGVEQLTALMARQLDAEEPVQLADPTLPPGLDHATAVFLGDEAAMVVGRNLTEVNLRARTGATVVAIQHKDGCVSLPTGREQLRHGDLLALVGTTEAVAKARTLLASSNEE